MTEIGSGVAYDVEEGEGAPDGIVGVGEGDGAKAILVVAMHRVLCRGGRVSNNGSRMSPVEGLVEEGKGKEENDEETGVVGRESSSRAFVLDVLAAAGGGAEGDGAGDEEDELAGGGALEVAEVADVRRVGQHHSLLLPAAGGGGIARGFEHQQRRDLHRGFRPRGRGRRRKRKRKGGELGAGC